MLGPVALGMPGRTSRPRMWRAPCQYTSGRTDIVVLCAGSRLSTYLAGSAGSAAKGAEGSIAALFIRARLGRRRAMGKLRMVACVAAIAVCVVTARQGNTQDHKAEPAAYALLKAAHDSRDTFPAGFPG